MPLLVTEIQRSILRKNTTLALELRERFARNGTFVLNLLSSPGAGKTTLLEETLRTLGERYRVGAIVGDQATDNDAVRLARSRAPVKQIVTGSECRLDALMIGAALEGFPVDDFDILAIENVGNLICPAEYDLGEDMRVVLFSVTEGEDKPLKYPLAFITAQLAIVSKIDIAQAAGFNREAALENIARVHPGLSVIELSAKSGAGMSEWIDYVEAGLARKREMALAAKD